MKHVFREGCPPWENLAAMQEGRLGAEEKAKVEQHAGTCAFCRTDLAMLAEFAEARPAASEAADVERISARLRKARAGQQLRSGGAWWHRWGLAMAALVLVVVGVQWQARRNVDLDRFEESGTMRSAVVPELSPRGDIAEVPANFAWSAVPGAVQYEIIVSEADGTELWRWKTKERQVSIPTPVAASFLPLKTIVWEVAALDATGALVARSEAVRVRRTER